MFSVCKSEWKGESARWTVVKNERYNTFWQESGIGGLGVFMGDGCEKAGFEILRIGGRIISVCEIAWG